MVSATRGGTKPVSGLPSATAVLTSDDDSATRKVPSW